MDPQPDPYKNFMDPQHWVSPVFRIRIDLTLEDTESH
jgi:hypothetical protein